MLEISGLLNQTMFGPPEPLKRADDGQWVEDDGKGNPNRRSIYLAYARTRPEGFLRAFDCPDMTSDSQSERFRAALPIQSLALLNNPLAVRVSKAIAGQVMEQSQSNIDEAVSRAFSEIYSRPAYPEELSIAKQAIAAAPDPSTGLRLLIQGMLGANDFLYSF
jgi:hypothetical protein